jgi:hypothetical protein
MNNVNVAYFYKQFTAVTALEIGAYEAMEQYA